MSAPVEPTRAEHLGHRLTFLALLSDYVAAEDDQAARARFNESLRTMTGRDAADGYLGALDVLGTLVRLDPIAQGVLDALADGMRAELAADDGVE